MVLTESSSYKEMSKMNHFKLMNTSGKEINSKDYLNNKGILLIFTCNHCPYAKVMWTRIIEDYKEIKENNFDIIAINPNINPNYPEDSPLKMKELIKEKNLPFEYLIDEHQDVAKKYDAKCTPDFFLLNNEMSLLYRGCYDDNWKNEHLVKKKFILETIKYFNETSQLKYKTSRPSIGCSIKWLENN